MLPVDTDWRLETATSQGQDGGSTDREAQLLGLSTGPAPHSIQHFPPLMLLVLLHILYQCFFH